MRTMKAPPVPFVRLNGRTYLNLSFTLAPATDVPPLPKLLQRLLRHTASANVLLLRALGPAEEKIVRATLGAAEHEGWARVVVRDQDRYRPRR